MGESDKFLDAMNVSVDKWMGAKPEVNIFGKKISTNPNYISILYKEQNNKEWTFLNGIEDQIGLDNNNAGFSTEVSVGDSEQGYGRARSARDNIPRNAEMLGGLMDSRLDFSTKYAVKAYLTHISDTSVYDGINVSKNSEEDVAVSVDSGLSEISISENLRGELKKFTGDVYKNSLDAEVDATIITSHGVQRFVDSEGRTIRESSKLGKVYFSGAFSHDSGQSLSHLEAMTFLDKVDYKELGSMMDNFCLAVDDLRSAVTPVSGQYPIIFSGSAVGTMIHEALGGHLLSGKYIKDGTSTAFKDRIDTLVLPEFMTVVDDPRMKGASGFYLFDDQGIASKNTILIEDGVLKNYLLDRDSAEYFGLNSNGHSRMEWVLDHENGIAFPEPRVSNLDIRSNNSVSEGELEEIARKYCRDSGVECALYVESGAGQVDVSTSEFMLQPDRAYKIFPDGRREPVHNFVVVANAYELLSQIAITSDKYEVAHGICGAESGGIPTQERAPSAFIPKVNVQAVDSLKLKKKLL